MSDPQAIYRIEQIQALEQVAIQQFHIAGYTLMQRAGMAAFRHIQARWPQYRQIQVFCGLGNNGGDGYVIARLAMQAGLGVRVFSLGDTTKLSGDAGLAYQDFMGVGGEVNAFSGACLPSALIVDALLGTGLNRPVDEHCAAMINAINASGNPILAVDVPSGLNADNGCVMGCAVRADLTVTFIGQKCGLVTGEAVDYCGELRLDELSLPGALFSRIQPFAQTAAITPLPKRPLAAHKGLFGHVLLVGGNLGYSGAIRMAAEACLRSGAGLVSVATRQAHAAQLNMGRPEIMVHAVEDEATLSALLEKASIAVIGPGLGQDVWATAMYRRVLQSHLPLVMDADALNLLSIEPLKRQEWVLTPHPGEAARLLGCSSRDITQDRYQAVQSLQQRYGGVCLLKGAGSLIAGADRIRVAQCGNPGMASGGMGDVLSGIIAGLLAQHMPLGVATETAVMIHAKAADRLAAQYGERGLLASDLYGEIRYWVNC